MRVAFDSRPANDVRGIGRYARCLLTALRDTAGEDDVLVETHRPKRCDVFHSPWIDGALVRPHCPQVVTMHDLDPLKRRSENLRTGLRFSLRYLDVQRSAHLIVPTRAVAADAVDCLAIDASRITIVPEAPAPVMTPRDADEVAAVRERHGLPEDYLLWVGGMEFPDPRKRVAELAATPRELPLVLAGPTREWAHELEDVLLTGRVTDDELAALSTGARALVLASDDEGFGLTPVEALACGTPVVACEVPALREVLGDRVTFVDRDDLAGLLAAAAQASRPAPAPPAWTWEDAARATWDAYRDAIATG